MKHNRHLRHSPQRDRGHWSRHALQHPQEIVPSANVVIAGLFSARRKDYAELMDELEAEVADLGCRVSARFVQRRGISGNKKGRAPGGKANMDKPYSARTLMSTGKVDEIAEACVQTRAEAVIFYNELTDRQRLVLVELFGCAVFSRQELRQAARSTP